MAEVAFRCKTGIHKPTNVAVVEDFDGNEISGVIIRQGTLVMLDPEAPWVQSYEKRGCLIRQGSKSVKPKTTEQLMKMKKEALLARAEELQADVDEDMTKEQLAEAILALQEEAVE